MFDVIQSRSDSPACTSGVAYMSVQSQQVVFTSGQTQQQVNVALCGDTLTQPTETLNIGLLGPNVGAPATAVVSINDTASQFQTATRSASPAQSSLLILRP